MSESTDLLGRYEHALLGVFGRPALVLDHGSGPWVWDVDGRRYLDLLGGIAVNALGHGHPALVAAVSKQVGELVHVSNFFTSRAQVELGERLLAVAGAPEGSRVFLANSGTEAVEAAIKLARRTGRTEIIAAEDAFHGRSTGALALTHKPAYREPFEPLLPGVRHVPFGDAVALEAAVTEATAAVVLEPIQGEAGVVVPDRDYLRAAREVTERHGALLVVDEVQTGVGRTGEWFGFQSAGIVPDAITVAKGLGGGVPIGALVTFGANASGLLGPGNHGSTFGGNPLACAAALAVLDAIEREGLRAHAIARRRAPAFAHRLPGAPGDRWRPRTRAAPGDPAHRAGRRGPRRARPRRRLHRQPGHAERPSPRPSARHHRRGGRPVRRRAPRPARRRPRRPAADRRPAMTVRHFLRDDDLSAQEQARVLDRALALKADPFADRSLAGPQVVGILFDKPTLRTQVSFTAAVAHLGGHPMVVDGKLAGVGVRESIADSARVLGRQVAAIVWRTYGQDRIEEMAHYAGVPVVNALTDDYHPCQVLADLLTVREHKSALPGLTLAYLGDGANNMAHSYLLGCALAGMHVRIGTPDGYLPNADILARARRLADEQGGSVLVTADPLEAARGADVVATDTWVSMGQESESADRKGSDGPFTAFAVTPELMGEAAGDAIFLHCLPAYRGYEVAPEVIDGPQSVVWDEAENRLHAQKAVLSFLLEESRG